MKGKIFMKNTRGFTLAEVLVTLAVIGVVAALTIPTLMSSSNEKQAKTAVKKATSILNQALTMSIAEEGVGASSTNNSLDLQGLFANYMSILSYDNTNDRFTSADGMTYTFYKNSSNNCTAETDNQPPANCMVEVDINGSSGSSIAASTTSYTDLYYFIVHDTNVVPANASTTWAPASHAANFKATSGNVDNVALDALIN